MIARPVNQQDVQVRGAATAEDRAAIVAALQAQQSRQAEVTRFARWRRQRLAVLRDNR